MIDFVEYVVKQLSSKRLRKADALDLIRQFQSASANAAGTQPVGTLLRRNTSDFTQQSYESTFTGEEPFLRDHVIKGHRVLPGVVYLEMVRQAVIAASPQAGDPIIEIRNVVWAQPIVADATVSATVALFPADSFERDGAIDYEIYSIDEGIRSTSGDDSQAGERIHSQGQIVFVERDRIAPRQDSAALTARMRRGRLDGERLYATCTAMGMEYGPAQRAVIAVEQGEGEVLAHLALPPVWDRTSDGLVLHPALMDAALQSVLGFIDDIDTVPTHPRLPFAVDTVRILAPCTDRMTAWLRLAPGATGADRITRVDIDLCDADGQVCVQWRGFSSRMVGADPVPDGMSASGVLYAIPVWQDDAAEASGPIAVDEVPIGIDRHVLLCGALSRFADTLGGLCVHPVPASPGALPEDTYSETAQACFLWLKQHMQAQPTRAVSLQLAVPSDEDGDLLLGLAGMLRSAALENPMINGQVVSLPSDATAIEVEGWLREAHRRPRDTVQRFARARARQTLVWNECEHVPDSTPLPYRTAGVYLITGGLGGLGRLFARAIVSACPQARVVLTGRSEAGEEVAAKLKALALPEDAVVYRKLDVANRDEVSALLDELVRSHGRIDGILHCAGGLRDGFIRNKSLDDLDAVLEPKVRGTCNLDEASRELDLDFLVLFSAGASVTGNVGQADYAAANGFLDRFAHQRNARVIRGERRGVTRAINWPLWAEGGMTVSEQVLERARRLAGLHPLQTDDGMEALHYILAQPHPQVQVVQGEIVALREVLLGRNSAVDAVASASVRLDSTPPSLADEVLADTARQLLRQKLSGLLKLPAHLIESDAPFEKYGIDSIMMMNLTNALETDFGSLPKTLFFEYQTMGELAGYFLAAHRKTLVGLAEGGGADGQAASSTTDKPSKAADATLLPELAAPRELRRRRSRFASTPAPRHSGTRDDEPIAVVGLSGRYPGAPDLHAYWRNLSEGVDSIVEVPASRWDWREYFSDDRTKPGHHYSRWGGFIEGVDEFDALFFNIPPADAERIDPQERLFLQHTWAAVEDAGYTRASLQIRHGDDQPGQVGVYVGVMYGEYQLFGAEASLLGQRGVTPSSYASIANRISYFLNLHGPSLALDTMCSSSLTAIHLACQDLRLGRTDLAIAGGVNVSIHPNKYLLLSSGQFIATEGRCQSFGEGGDGYIPAEGVGVVLLKRLSDAESDGNHIYGLIRGSALNHGGKTNGYSVPNPQAQASVIGLALQSCAVDARHISYLEAHGTGTRLGDPIEIAALTQAFRKYTPEAGFCLLGSAKSNIGHAESAAGIAGLTKVLLQMKHQMVVPSLHSNVLNPHIDFDSTPFVVNQVLRPWERPLIDGRPVPRLAGISSFGAGGSNAHLIVEEYVPGPRERSVAESDRSSPQAVLLSARMPAQLEAKVRDLIAFLRADGEMVNLVDLAYTLQIGREGMEERLGLVAGSMPELLDALECWLAGRDTPNLHQGRTRSGDTALALFDTDADLQAMVDRWLSGGRLSRVLELWVQGVAVDWSSLHKGSMRPRFVSLPTYPFARERCWVERVPPITAGGTSLHPLVQVNVSDLHEQAYRSTFSGDEFFLADHRLRSAQGSVQQVLPGVAYLEMMRTAVLRALPEWADGPGLELVDVKWLRPLAVVSATEVTIALSPGSDGDLSVEIRTSLDGTVVLHSTGRAREVNAEALAILDLDLVRLRLQSGSMTGAEVYARYERLGIDYGTTFRSIRRLEMGEREVLAELCLPDAACVHAEAFGLHPALLDGALQSAIGMLEASAREIDQVPLPFALRSIRVLSPCVPEMTAWLRYSTESQNSASGVELDIDVCDRQGRVCVAIRGLISRAAPSVIEARTSVWTAVPQWTRQTSPTLAADSPSAGGDVLVCGLPSLRIAALAAALPGHDCQASVDLPEGDCADRYDHHALAVLNWLRRPAVSPQGAQRRLQLVVPDQGEYRMLAGLDGMLRTAVMEDPRLQAQLVRVSPNVTGERLARQLREAACVPSEAVVSFSDDAMHVLRWHEQDIDPEPLGLESFLRDDGVYLITGGLGGLGQQVARHLLSRTSRATVVLTGRGALDASRQAMLDRLSPVPGRVHYRSLDVSDAAQARTLVLELVESLGALHGVLHSAGETRDSLLSRSTEADLRAVLMPKVRGTTSLDEATADIHLDFFALFSSLSGALGNVGQANYAAANGFLDQFAAYREQRVAMGERHGRTVSINWPLWADGGMRLDPAQMDLLRRTTGAEPLPTAEGLKALEHCLREGASQVLVLSGDRERLQRLLAPRIDPVHVGSVAPRSDKPDNVDVQKAGSVEVDSVDAERFVRSVFARVLKTQEHQIDPQASLERYGIDSVVAMTLTVELEKSFGTLPKTLLFEQPTVARLARYLSTNHPQRVRELVGSASKEGAMVPVPPPLLPSGAKLAKRRFVQEERAPLRRVAIVGLAGRYPQADNLDAFWSNLREGRDCITEVPSQRWDHSRYFDAARNTPGRTYSKWGGFLSEIDCFDALFFNVSPREAELIDPQERLFLEIAWETVEDAGYSKEHLAGQRIGVYVGVMWGHYELYGAAPDVAAVPTSSHASVANRVSYFFDLRGPSLALDTMCSSSLSAIHLATEDIRRGVVDAAIAGGVNLSLHPQKYLNLSQGNFVSSDGRCRSFGDGGDGYVPGEGVGAVFLKPLDQAERDGDQIYGVIEASALNHGGKTHGYTVPNPDAQAELIRDVLKSADIDPRSVGYIETHGTGTALGDPIELASLHQAMAADGADPGSWPIGSVKSNIGHLEAAAGIAALTKALLQIRHGELVPSLHADTPNPNINFAISPFRVQTVLAPWLRAEAGESSSVRRIAVSAFGAGGSNAHMIVSEHVATGTAAATFDEGGADPVDLFVLSARDDAALVRYARRMVEYLRCTDRPTLREIAHTSRVGRSAMAVRLAVLASSLEALAESLSRWANTAREGIGITAQVASDGVFAGRVVDSAAGGLIVGAAGQAFLDDLLMRGDWPALARLWVAGANVDWTRVRSDSRPRRVSLPTYPFARDRYWIPQARSAVPQTLVRASDVASTRPMDVGTLLYRPDWVEFDQIDTEKNVVMTEPVLVLNATKAWTLALAQRLTSTPIISVIYGDGFRDRGSDLYVVDPARDEDIEQLLAELKARSCMPGLVIHCSEDPIAPEDKIAVTGALDRSLHMLSALARELMVLRQTGPTRFLSLVACDTPAGRALGTAMSGFYASLQQENPSFTAKVLEWSETGTLSPPVEEGIQTILGELNEGDWRCQRLRFVRSTTGMTRRFRRHWSQTTLATAFGERSMLRQGGVYLITGGLGALGYGLAEFLLRQVQARVMLVGRSPINDSIERRLEALRAIGGEVLYHSVDVADTLQVEAAVRGIRSRYGRIDGILHAAGVRRDAFVLKKTRAERETVVAPKVQGTLNLDRATAQEPLDLFVVFSSVAGALGNAGQSDYAFANAFLDAFAHERALQVAQGCRSGHTMAINWPLWDTAGGMRPADEMIARANDRIGLAPLPMVDGLRVFHELLGSGETQVMVVHGDRGRIADALQRTIESVYVAAEAKAATAEDADASTNLLRLTVDYLKRCIGEEIHLDPSRVDEHERFDAYGIDSMMVARLNDRLAADLGELSKTLFYEYTNIAELASQLIGEAAEQLTRLLRPQSMLAAALPLRSAVEFVPESATLHAPGSRPAAEPIAIVGMHGYYPGSEDLEALWHHLSTGTDLIGEVPAERWDAEAHYDPDPAKASEGKIYCKWGAFLDQPDRFDAAFFNIGDHEARSMDPQERLFLQSVWSALEDAGTTRAELKRRFPKGKSANVGVFVGVTTNSYHLLGADRWHLSGMDSPSALPWSIANRVSYFFDFLGPSMPVDTACSSSLVAIHMACESLRRGECGLAVAGGVNLYLHPAKYHGLCQRRMLARHGKCRSYGHGDDGFVPGEGVGSMVLKPLSKAEADGDRIHGVIRGSAYAHSGRANGYSAPNPQAQSLVIAEALRQAGVDAESISYVEGHGTGTQLGDSLEIRALTHAFANVSPQTCALGSVKSNLGHTESAAGVLGVTKVLLQMRHRQMAPSLHSERVNENIDFEKTPFRLQRDLAPWSAPRGGPRRALLNAFGAGGVNACLILDEYVPVVVPSSSEQQQKSELFVLSARSEERLRAYARTWVDYLCRPGATTDLSTIARNLGSGREAMSERLAVVVADVDQLVLRLRSWLDGDENAVHRGPIDARRIDRPVLKHDEGMLDEMVRKQDLNGLAEAWVMGAELSWDQLMPASSNSCSGLLPTYPFADRRYWPQQPSTGDSDVSAARGSGIQLHPLVSHNASNLRQTRYTSVLSREDFCARDHRVRGERMLPGSAWLEMARVAGCLATVTGVRRLRDVVFANPLVFTEPLHVAVTTISESGDEIAYSISSQHPMHGTVVHSEGLLDESTQSIDARVDGNIAVAELIKRSTRCLDGTHCYDRLRSTGLEHGPSFQTIQKLYRGEDFVLATLSLPACVQEDADEFVLHPSLIDGALQSIAGFADDGETSAPFLPFAIDEVIIHGVLSRNCVVHAVERSRSAGAGGRNLIRKFDIGIGTPNGTLAVSLSGFSVRALEVPSPSSSMQEDHTVS